MGARPTATVQAGPGAQPASCAVGIVLTTHFHLEPRLNKNIPETWSLTLREERKLRVFENMVLRRILGPRRDEVTGEWRRLHNEELMICTPHPILCE